VRSPDPGSSAARVVLRPIGSPLPLGLLALFVGSLLLSAVQLRWFQPTHAHVIAIAVLAIVVPLQLLGCVFGLLDRDPACATGMGLLSGTWAATGVSTVVGPPGGVQAGLGVVLVIAAGALLVPAAGAASKAVLTVVLAGAAIRFAISGGYELTGSQVWAHASGIAGIAVAALAVYAALAFELEATLGRPVLPIGRTGAGRRAVSGRLDYQIADLAREPGVRKQL
jgi:succinate-acetate transporter protein